MKIGVLVKPVPDPELYGRITIDPETRRLNRDGVPMVLNPADKCAIEEALRLRDKFGGSVTVFSMAPPEGREKLLECLAMGADEAVLASDRAFGGADTMATSYTLVRAMQAEAENEAFDLVLSGNESADGATGHVPAQVGELIGFNHLSSVVKIEAESAAPGTLRIFQKYENGRNEFIIGLPAVLGVTRDINKPRYTSAMGIIKARRKPLKVVGIEDIGADESRTGSAGSPTQAGAVYTPDTGRKCAELTGSPDEIAEELVKRIKAAGVKIVAGGACVER